MFWPILAALLLIAVFAIHFFWRKRFRLAVEQMEKELAHLREISREKSSQAEARQKALLNSMVEGLLLLDNTGRVQLANQALEHLFGVTSAVYGKTMIETFRNHQLAELAGRLPIEHQILGYEIQLSEIQSRWIQVNAALITDPNGNQNGMVFVFHDQTQLRELENTRQEFVANVSHELRTPLSMIKGYVETLLDGAKDNPEVAAKFLQTIERHTERLAFLIEDLLTISKLESGQVILSLQEIELKPAIQKVIEDLKTHADAKQVKLENHIPPGFIVTADFDRLEQVLWNLIDNAIKYGKSPGLVEISGAFENNEIKIWVRNDGPEIPPALQARVFERFFRLDKARSSDQGGSGLGLAIVKHIVQRHDGRVWVESKPAGGTTFFFTLPSKKLSD